MLICLNRYFSITKYVGENMLTEDRLIQLFNEQTKGNRQAEGLRVLNNDLVTAIELKDKEKVLTITGNVISENLFNEYITKIGFDTDKLYFLSTFCSCNDFEKSSVKKKNYCCKHLVATFYKGIDDLLKHPLLKEDRPSLERLNESGTNTLRMLLGDDNEKEELKIEVYINKNQWNDSISAEFKIGTANMASNCLYCLKDINHFLIALENKVQIPYSKNFIFDINCQRLDVKDKRLIDFIYTLKNIEGKHKSYNRNEDMIVDGKYLNIPSYHIREFFNTIINHRVYLNEGFFHRPVETDVLNENPPIDFDLKLIKDNYILKSFDGMPLSLGSKSDVFLYGSCIYLPEYSYCYKINPYLRIFHESKVVTIPVSAEDTILRKLIPELHSLTSKVSLAKTIQEKIIRSKSNFCFYFDRQDENLILKLNVKYGGYEFNIFEDYKEKVIYRDLKKEETIKSEVRSLGFEKYRNVYHFMKGEEDIFNLFKNEVTKLQALGEVYYSENFKGIKSIGSKGIIGNIKSGKYDYFNIDFKIGDLSEKDISGILRAFRENLKYYKLKDGEFIDLEELELRNLLKLLDAVTPEEFEGESVVVPNNKALYMNSYIEEHNLRYISGKSELQEISDKIKKINTLSLSEPNDLKANLRKYQKLGLNWFQTLDHLGFGGILGDEMGLGKTVQTIAFLLSKKGSKSLVITPTSLVYNWVSEFEKFAPTLSVAAVNGSREEREEIIKEKENYDVLVTTYNLLKRDLDLYSFIEFDYCIIDEAQNIKNANSQNALSVKEIKSKRRFALTGTPIENSLMELWSIFDFIMPGYLFDEKRFNVRYHKKLREEPEVLVELNKLTKPFILRRRKCDVIKELPAKIEKTLMVTLDEEQKRVYSAYTKHALELIAKKVKDDEFKNSKIEILSYITKLRQLCLDPSVVMDDYVGGSGKIDALLELLQQSIEEGHRVLIFSQFTSILMNISKRLCREGISYSYLDGSIPSNKRMEIVNKFNNGENSVFLISLKAGGTGLNLTSADVVVHFDPWWNPAVEDQATDRVHRIGQEKVVEVIKMIAKGTIEEKILLLQGDKRKLISEVLSEGLSEASVFLDLSEAEIMELFDSKII